MTGSRLRRSCWSREFERGPFAGVGSIRDIGREHHRGERSQDRYRGHDRGVSLTTCTAPLPHSLDPPQPAHSRTVVRPSRARSRRRAHVTRHRRLRSGRGGRLASAPVADAGGGVGTRRCGEPRARRSAVTMCRASRCCCCRGNCLSRCPDRRRRFGFSSRSRPVSSRRRPTVLDLFAEAFCARGEFSRVWRPTPPPARTATQPPAAGSGSSSPESVGGVRGRADRAKPTERAVPHPERRRRGD